MLSLGLLQRFDRCCLSAERTALPAVRPLAIGIRANSSALTNDSSIIEFSIWKNAICCIFLRSPATICGQENASREKLALLIRSPNNPSRLGESTRAWIASLFVTVWFVGILIHVVYRFRDWRLCGLQLRKSSPNSFAGLTQAFNQALSQHQLRRTPRLLVSPAISAPVVVLAHSTQQ